MEPISNADRFVALLREKLAERADAKTARHEGPQPRGAALQGADAARGLAVSAARAGQDDRKLRRTIVEQLLSERFGARLTNEPRFQELITQVTEMMGADPELGAILQEVIAEVRR